VRYWMAGQILYEFGSGDKEELRSKTWERRRVINWAFLSSVSSLLFSSLLFSSLLCSSPYIVTSLDLGPV